MAIDLTARRWIITYTHLCVCRPGCLAAGNGRCGNRTYLNNGEENLPPEQAAAKVADMFGHTDIADVEIRQETPEQRDRRVASQHRESAQSRYGTHWGMGGAN